MAKKPSIRELRKHLEHKTPPELIEEIVTLYTRYEAVKEFYMAQLHGSYDQELLNRYKAIITNEFFTRSAMPGPGRIAVARRAVMDYKKLAASPESIAEIMLHYVETGVAYMRAYGDDGTARSTSMARMYADAVKHIDDHDLRDQFQDRCKQIMHRADGCGFHEVLVEIYYTNFEIPEDDEAE